MPREFHIDNEIPRDRAQSWLFGASATPAEQALAIGVGLLGAALVWLWFVRPNAGIWTWWQVSFALVFTVDLFAGAASNATSATKQQYQAPTPPGGGRLARLARDPTVFAAAHVYPLAVAALFPGVSWSWALGWYAGVLATVALLDRVVPTWLQRPCAMSALVLSVPVSLALPGPEAWRWLPLVFLAKLVLGRAVHEEAYRPPTAGGGGAAAPGERLTHEKKLRSSLLG